MTTDFKIFKKKLLKKKEVQEAYENLKVEFEVSRSLIKARTKANLTQKQLAEKMHTSQATIARYESGKHLPSLRTIQKYAHATGSTIDLHIS